MISKIEIKDRKKLYTILNECSYDRVLIDSVLEGDFGYTDAIIINNEIKTVRLDSGSFTIIAGDSSLIEVDKLFDIRPIYVITPQNLEWDNVIKKKYKNLLVPLKFVEFHYKNTNTKKLQSLINIIPDSYHIKEFDCTLSKKAEIDLENEYLFENFNSLSDFIDKGLGFCTVHNGLVVSAATSMAKSSKAIDIEIQTHKDYRKRGLASAVGAKLVLSCIEKGVKPMWLAANVASEKLAEKIGYTKTGEYISYSVSDINA